MIASPLLSVIELRDHIEFPWILFLVESGYVNWFFVLVSILILFLFRSQIIFFMLRMSIMHKRYKACHCAQFGNRNLSHEIFFGASDFHRAIVNWSWKIRESVDPSWFVIMGSSSRTRTIQVIVISGCVCQTQRYQDYVDSDHKPLAKRGRSNHLVIELLQVQVDFGSRYSTEGSSDNPGIRLLSYLTQSTEVLEKYCRPRRHRRSYTL